MNKFGELRDSGLLWWLNTEALHPYGLALGLQYNEDGEAVGYKIYKSEDGFWEFDDESNEEGKEKFRRYLDSLQESDRLISTSKPQ